MLFVGLTVAVLLAVQLTATDPRPRRAWHAIFGITVLQGLVGYTQYLTGLPEVLVLVHMLGASLMAVSLTFGVLTLRERPAQAAATGSDGQVQQRVDGDGEEDQRQVADRVVEEPHGVQ